MPPPLHRRDFLKASAAATVAATLPACDGGAPRPAGGLPHVLYVLSDSHRASDMGCAGNPEARTPHMDRLAAEGLRLTTALSSTPLCRPYRANLMSGCFPHRTGLLTNRSEEHNFGIEDGFQWTPRGVPLLAEHFRAHGYRCGYVGKWHLGSVNTDPGPLRFGFDDAWLGAAGDVHEYYAWRYNTGARGDFEEGAGFRATRETDRVLELLRRAADDTQPWFLVLSFGPPHDPYKAPPGFVHEDVDYTVPPNVPAGFLTDRIGGALRGYHGLVEALDHELGRLLDALDATGLADDTLVVYTSDHGNLLGTHGYEGKEMPYDESTRVPFLMRWPGRVPVGTDDMPLGTPDLFPTLAGLVGLPGPDGVDGRDFSARLRGEAGAPSQDDAYLVSHLSRFVEWPGWKGLRTRRHLFATRQDGPWMLYDLEADPYQLENLVDREAELAKDLDERTRATMAALGDSWRVG